MVVFGWFLRPVLQGRSEVGATVDLRCKVGGEVSEGRLWKSCRRS